MDIKPTHPRLHNGNTVVSDASTAATEPPAAAGQGHLPPLSPTPTLGQALGSPAAPVPPLSCSSSPPPPPPATRVSVMLPLDTVSAECVFRYAGVPWFSQALNVLAASGVHSVAFDVWWGAVEREPRQYNWSGFKHLLEVIKPTGLKVQIVLSFHACGGNVGDTTNIPLPRWVLQSGQNDPDLFFTDRPRGNTPGQRNREYVSIWCDDEAGVLCGRSPMQCYEDLMSAFREAFEQELGTLIDEIVVGSGPCGELRYPAYLEANGWKFPGVGEFQCYDRRAMASLATAARLAGHPEWGTSGPHDAGDYNSVPEDTGFFKSDGSWNTPYGRFFLDWYSGCLLRHGDRLLAAASLTLLGAPRLRPSWVRGGSLPDMHMSLARAYRSGTRSPGGAGGTTVLPHRISAGNASGGAAVAGGTGGTSAAAAAAGGTDAGRYPRRAPGQLLSAVAETSSSSLSPADASSLSLTHLLSDQSFNRDMSSELIGAIPSIVSSSGSSAALLLQGVGHMGSILGPFANVLVAQRCGSNNSAGGSGLLAARQRSLSASAVNEVCRPLDSLDFNASATPALSDVQRHYAGVPSSSTHAAHTRVGGGGARGPYRDASMGDLSKQSIKLHGPFAASPPLFAVSSNMLSSPSSSKLSVGSLPAGVARSLTSDHHLDASTSSSAKPVVPPATANVATPSDEPVAPPAPALATTIFPTSPATSQVDDCSSSRLHLGGTAFAETSEEEEVGSWVDKALLLGEGVATVVPPSRSSSGCENTSPPGGGGDADAPALQLAVSQSQHVPPPLGGSAVTSPCESAPIPGKRSVPQPGYFYDGANGGISSVPYVMGSVAGRSLAPSTPGPLPSGALTLSLKVAGVHWWFRSASHAAELTAGYGSGSGPSDAAYRRLVDMCAKHHANLTLTCVEMCDAQHPPNAACGPEGLLFQIRMLAAHRGVNMSGENALPIFLSDCVDSVALDRVAANVCGVSMVAHSPSSSFWVYPTRGGPTVGGTAGGTTLSAPYTADGFPESAAAAGGGGGRSRGPSSSGGRPSPPASAGRGNSPTSSGSYMAMLDGRRVASGPLVGIPPSDPTSGLGLLGAGGSGEAAQWGGGGGGEANGVLELPPMRSFTLLRLGPELLLPSHQIPWQRFMQRMMAN